MDMTPQTVEPCEREQLHLSAAVQAHGTLIAADDTGTVTHVASNVGRFLGGRAQGWLGRTWPQALAELALTLAEPPGSRRTGGLNLSVEGVEVHLQLMMTRGVDGTAIVELTPRLPAFEEQGGGIPRYFVPACPRDLNEMAAQRTAIVERIAELTGYIRVMYYRFRDDGDGEVIAEARRGDAYGSYLGLRYPASDIPQVARDLYLKNPWRMIPDAAAAPVPILAAGGSPLDLTYSDLRRVSPVHQAYLANMGVAASLSFPLVQRGVLVGLIAAHHNEVQHVSYGVLLECAARVSSHAETAYLFAVQQRLQWHDAIAHRIYALRPYVQSLQRLRHGWDQVAPLLAAEMRADSIQLFHGGLHLSHGYRAAPAVSEALDTWFALTCAQGLAHTEGLLESGVDAGVDDIAGVFGIHVFCRAGEFRLYFSRREEVHEVAWGGRPDKPIERSDGDLAIAPRRSFDKWVEKRFGRSRPWGSHERHFALSLRVLIGAMIDY